MEYIVRQARTRDVPEIRALIDQNIGSRRLLEKHTVNLYEDILEFSVSESSSDGVVAGCGALHVLWEDLAELRTVAVDESRRGEGIGHLIVDDLLDRARRVGVSRVFVLTFAVSFFDGPTSGKSVVRQWRQRFTLSCCVPTMMASPSSWTWTA